jgi:amino acid adenylation domain-containing protein
LKYTYTLPHLIEQSAERFSDKIAFRFLGNSLTYSELLIKMNQLANQLIELGVKKGDRVGIFMARSLETAVAMYGIMQAGAVYVPINPMQPAARTLFLLKDCGIQHIVTNAAQKRNLPQIIDENTVLKTVIGTEVNLPVSTISWASVFEQSASKPTVSILENDRAYVLYTSGSTGTPKGIVHTHYSGLAYAKLCVEAYDLTEKDILGNHAPIYFDISTLGFFAAPMVGATTIIASEGHIKLPASLSQLMETEQISVWYSVPLALIQMLQRGALNKRNMGQLRWVIFAGELFPTKHLKVLMQVWGNARFSNAYGPTETNVCTYYNVPQKLTSDAPISIGKPWGNTEILILDEAEMPVNKGEIGELVVRSGTLMEGYWGRPDLNRKAFLTIKKEDDLEAIFYKTGDLVKEEADGNLTFLGRKDRLVKTRGFRVELDEISTFLLQNEAVEEAAVYTVSNAEEEVLIEAAVILKNKQTITSEDLIFNLKKVLPSYALPHQIKVVAEFPRTATGKINLKEISSNHGNF